MSNNQQAGVRETSQGRKVPLLAPRAKRYAPLLLAGLLLLSGCESMNHTEKGLVTGGILGTAAGTVIGGLAGNPGAGAAIGAGTGLLAGGVTGAAVDRAEARADAKARAWAAAHPPLSMADVAQMAQTHISDAVIIQQIRTTGSNYLLSPNDIAWLKQQGVSDAVVMEMQTHRGPVMAPPPGRPGAVYVVEPPPPPVSVGVGVGFIGGGGCHHHHHHRGHCW